MTAEEKRRRAAELMKSRAGQNTYTNGSKRTLFFGDPEGAAGYSDCSSAVRACIQRAAGIDIGANTDKQLSNYKRGVVVEKTSGCYPDESKLKVGDCLYFKGNSAHYKQVGHVEMYTGKNECWGHGSGIGPKKHDLKAYCKSRATAQKRYFCAIRWINETASDTQEPASETAEVYPANPMPVRWRGIGVVRKWQSKSAANSAGK